MYTRAHTSRETPDEGSERCTEQVRCTANPQWQSVTLAIPIACLPKQLTIELNLWQRNEFTKGLPLGKTKGLIVVSLHRNGPEW